MICRSKKALYNNSSDNDARRTMDRKVCNKDVKRRTRVQLSISGNT